MKARVPDVLVPARPSEYATDEEWARDLLDRVWELEGRLGTTQAMLADIEKAIGGWRTDQAEWDQWANQPEAKDVI